MNFNKLIIAFGLCALIFSAVSSCKKEEEVSEWITPLNYSTSALRDTMKLSINSPYSWTLEIADDWLTADRLTGGKVVLDSVFIYIGANPSREKRVGNVRIRYNTTQHSGRISVITQSGIKDQINVTTESVRESYEQKKLEINIQANVDWDISHKPNWINVDKITKGQFVDSLGLWNYDIEATLMANNLIHYRLDSLEFTGKTADVKGVLSLFQDGNSTLKTDSLALLKLHQSANGDSWKTKWDLSKPMSKWHGVELAEVNISQGTQLRVVSVALNDNGLTGTITSSISNLVFLKRLWLQDNDITTYQPTLSSLTNLENLRLENNANLSGSLPADMGNMKSLLTISINHTQMNGVLPASIGDIEYLTSLDLSNNAFSGELPEKLGSNNNLSVLILKNNFFSGKIPDSYKANYNWYNWNIVEMICLQRGTKFTNCEEF